MQSWQRDETHGNMLRTLWFVALGNPTYWVACLVLAHCASHVLLGWPDGSLVWILTTIFEKAVSHRLSSKRVPTDTYPPRDPRRRAPVSFGGLTRDLVVLCRQYFIPGEEDFLKLARQPVGKISSWKWNPTQGIPLGETAPPPILGRPKRVVEWPSFRFLVVTLDNKISTLARLFLTCSRCGVKRRVSHFVRAENEMLTAQVTGSAVGVAVCCSDWGLECDRPKESRILAPPIATTPTSAPPALRSSLRQGSGGSVSSKDPILSAVERQLKEAQEELAALKKKQGASLEGTAVPCAGSAALFLPPSGPELTNLDSQQVIKAWLHNVQQFCARMNIPESHRLGWAVSGLKGAASTAWSALSYGLDLETMTLEQMGEVLMKHFFQKHSMLALWGKWANLRQGASEDSQEYADRAKELLGQENLPDHWASAAFLAGIKESLRTRFYKSLPTENDRSFTLEDISQLLVRFELTQSTLQGTTAPATGKRSREEAAPPSKKKPGLPTLVSHCWICGSTCHQWEACHRKKDTGCPSCGGDCQSLRVCPTSWRTKHGRDGISAKHVGRVQRGPTLPQRGTADPSHGEGRPGDPSS